MSLQREGGKKPSEDPDAGEEVKVQNPASPSGLSLKTHQSMGNPDDFRKGPASLPPTGVSLKSHQSMGIPDDFRKGEFPTEEGPASLPPTGVSLKSHQSMGIPDDFRKGEFPTEEGYQHVGVGVSGGPAAPDRQLNLDTLQVFESKAIAFLKQALKRHKKVLTAKHEGLFDEEEEVVNEEHVDAEASEAALKIALHVLRTMNEDGLAYMLEQSHYGELKMYQRELKSSLKRRCECLREGLAKQGNTTLLNKIYTELYVLEGDSRQINNEHEVRQIETAFNRPRSLETPIKCEDLFKPSPRQTKPIRTVLTKGIAGIGKTVLAQKFMLDWSDEKGHQDIQLLFSLPFRELNLLKEEKRSLMELLRDFSIELKEPGTKHLERYSILFVLDGLDECRLPLDFQGNERCCDVTQSVSVDVLLTNLIAGNLLPKARLWITSRPAAANCIPSQYVDRVTEVRGFNDLQKEQYLNKKIDDVNLARRVITHMKSTGSLYIMCHIPVFCCISSTVLGKLCAEENEEMPKTLTQMYIHFLTFQTTQMYLKYCEQEELDPQGNNKIIMSLVKLAFQQLEKGNLIFYEEDLTNCGIDVREASVYSGICTQLFKEETWLRHKVFCFVHLSIQEFLAALYVYLMYMIDGTNLIIKQHGTSTEPQTSKTKSVATLHKAAVDRALQSDNGHLDLFLRFLLGLSLESNQALLKGFVIPVGASDSHSHEETIRYIKEKIREIPHPERCMNLFHCLNELNDHSLVEEIQSYLSSERDLGMDHCSPAQWSALVFVLLTSEEKLEVFDLKKYSRSEEGLLRLLPVVKASRSAMLNDCKLTEHCCEALSSILSSPSCELTDLNLNDNNLQDAGVELLCVGLRSPHCRLRTLRLNRCGLTQRSCGKLASVLSCQSSHLRELDLSDNDIEDSGVKLLSTGLESLCCELETLRLSFCGVTAEGCRFLASAVRSNPSHLRELDLSYNYPGDSGVKLLSETLEEEHCELTKLSVNHNAECWMKSGLRKYVLELSLDQNTAHKLLILSDGKTKVTQGREEQPYEQPDHPDRFDYWTQVLFQEGLTGRCYWEAEWEGNWAGLGVAYKGIGRKGVGNDCVMGYNRTSWGLHCSAHGYTAYHDIKSIAISVPSSGSRRVAVYLDWLAGTLSFYRVSSGKSLTHLYTFYTTFTEPLYPGFRVWDYGSSMSLRQLE